MFFSKLIRKRMDHVICWKDVHFLSTIICLSHLLSSTTCTCNESSNPFGVNESGYNKKSPAAKIPKIGPHFLLPCDVDQYNSILFLKIRTINCRQHQADSSWRFGFKIGPLSSLTSLHQLQRLWHTDYWPPGGTCSYIPPMIIHPFHFTYINLITNIRHVCKVLTIKFLFLNFET